MIKNKRLFVLVLLSIIVQMIFLKFSSLEISRFPFLDGVPLTSSRMLTYQYLLYWYFPVIVMSFYFSGNLREAIRFKGIPYITRRYSKCMFMIKQFLSMFFSVVFFTSFQFLIFKLFKVNTYDLSINTYTYMMVIYVGSLVVMISIQMYMELLFKSEIAQLIVSIYILVPILLSAEFQKTTILSNYFFLSNYAMGLRNGLNDLDLLSNTLVNSSYGMIGIVLLEVLLVWISIQRFKKLDIM